MLSRASDRGTHQRYDIAVARGLFRKQELFYFRRKFSNREGLFEDPLFGRVELGWSYVTRHVQERNARTFLEHTLHHLDTGDFRHSYVDQDHIDSGVACRYIERCLSTICRQNLITESFEAGDRQFSHITVVVDDQDRGFM